MNQRPLPQNAAELAAMIDHTLLKPETTAEQVRALCDEAIEYGFASACVSAIHVATAARCLKHSNVAVASVVGFPTGAHQSEVKKLEAHMALDDGADELDMVINLAVAQRGGIRYLLEDIGSVLDVCRGAKSRKILKVIFETAVLENDTIVSLCELCDNLGVDFIKTSTGLHASGGARVETVALMHNHRGQCRVKAAGGIRTWDDCKKMIAAGADRIGTSAGVAIMKTFNAKQGV